MTHTPFEKAVEPVTRLINHQDQSMCLQVRRARLRVIKGPDKGVEKMVPPQGLIIGSGSACTFRLADTAVSQRHCAITPTDESYRVHDLGSRNGTWVRGMRLGDLYLRQREEIQIGYTTLRLILMDGHEEYALSGATSLGQMLGRSVPMRQVFAVLERAGGSDATVLLEGESGTGKDLAAETLHTMSARKNGPLIVVDCGSMQSNLIESQLFGHRKGAFTGASSDQAGAFEAGNGGTVFLDEIGELDPALQPNLLRVLENRQVKRLGENHYRPVDVRLIAATNKDLESEMKAGRFRQDLFYRLSVVRVRMPALRDRKEDIRQLAIAIVQKLRADVEPTDIINDQVLPLLLNHDWPGNVRELRNVVERLLLFPDWPEAALTPSMDKTPGSGVTNVPLPPEKLLELPFHDARRFAMDSFERAYLSGMLDACQGVVSHAAKKADIPRQTFHRLIAKHKLGKGQDLLADGDD